MKHLLLLENHHFRALFHLVLYEIDTSNFICFHFCQYAWNDVVVEFFAYSLDLKALEWLEIFKDDLDSGAFFKSVRIYFSENRGRTHLKINLIYINWVFKKIGLIIRFLLINDYFFISCPVTLEDICE